VSRFTFSNCLPRATPLFIAIALIQLAFGQGASPRNSPRPWRAALTPDGQPDLQGVWMNTWATPFERPKELAGRQFLTEAEVQEFRKRVKRLFKDQPSDFPVGDNLFLAALANPEHWKNATGSVESADEMLDRDFDSRTSLVIDPPDGRIPPLTEAGQQRIAGFRAMRFGVRAPTGPKDLLPEQRCITYGVPRVGIYGTTPEGYQQIIQSPGYVVILMAGIHDARIVPLDGRPHLPQNMRTWNGDSRGRWEGKTLVVDTTNFSRESYFMGSTEGLHLVERFARVGPGEIDYVVHVDDPATWTRPWSARIRLMNLRERIIEYACHEGNYSMEDMLAASAKERGAK
jgi:hypothetical protein